MSLCLRWSKHWHVDMFGYLLNVRSKREKLLKNKKSCYLYTGLRKNTKTKRKSPRNLKFCQPPTKFLIVTSNHRRQQFLRLLQCSQASWWYLSQHAKWAGCILCQLLEHCRVLFLAPRSEKFNLFRLKEIVFKIKAIILYRFMQLTIVCVCV